MKAKIQVLQGEKMVLDGYVVTTGGSPEAEAQALYDLMRAGQRVGLRVLVPDIDDAPHAPVLVTRTGHQVGHPLTLNGYQQAVTSGGHSMDPNRACPVCGDMDGCHEPARLRRAGMSRPASAEDARGDEFEPD